MRNKEYTDWPPSRNTVSKAEYVNKNQQEAVLISDQPTAKNRKHNPEDEIVDEILNANPVNAEITDPIDDPLSPEAEIVENAKELDT